MNLWCQWRLIGIINPGEVSKLTDTCLSIKAFRVSVFKCNASIPQGMSELTPKIC
jgi:hypothetical protein